jgi:hypothetical protein
MKSKWLVIVSIFLVLAGAILLYLTTSSSIQRDEVLHDFELLDFPYVANKARQERIKSNSQNLAIGMLDIEVSKVLGKPDFSLPLYNTVKGGRLEGKSFFYVLSQDVLEGSVNAKNRRWIVIRFNLNNRLTRAYGSGISAFTDINPL